MGGSNPDTVDKLDTKLKRIADLPLFSSPYRHNLPWQFRILYSVMSHIPTFSNDATLASLSILIVLALLVKLQLVRNAATFIFCQEARSDRISAHPILLHSGCDMLPIELACY